MSQDLADDGPPGYRDPVGLHGVHLLTCQYVERDNEASGASFKLMGVYTHFDLEDGRRVWTSPRIVDSV